MIQKILITTMLLFALTSCHKEDAVNTPTPLDQSEDGAVPVQVSLGLKVATGVDYEPMRSDVDMPSVLISNRFTVVITKMIDNKRILHTMYEEKIDPNDLYDTKFHSIYDNKKFHSFSTELTPGDYRMVIITGSRSLNWYNLKKGQVIEDLNNSQFEVPQLCYYRKTGNGYLNPGKYGLEEEIFGGYKDFTVEKTDDLHSAGRVNEVEIQLDRKVSKFRILLLCEAYQVNSNTAFQFFIGQNNGIVAELNTTSSTPFCNGLNVWGEPFYDDSEVITTMYYGAFTSNSIQTGKDSKEYLMGIKDTRQLSSFYLSDPDYDIPVEISNVEVSASTMINTNYVYANNAAQSSHMNADPVVNQTLKHNTISGFVLKPGGEAWDDTRPQSSLKLRNMILEVDGSNNPVDASTIFDNYHENIR